MRDVLDLRERDQPVAPRRPGVDPSVAEAVRDILARVRADGDDALFELTLRFDGAELRHRGLEAAPDEFAAAERDLPGELKGALDGLVERLTVLHRRQLPSEWRAEGDGIHAGEIVRPVRRAGCYVPGGRAVYPSSVCMTVVPAVVAGVEEIVVTTPPRQDGSLSPAVLYAAARAGATRVVKVGGAQAIGALAFGTESVPSADRIVGPGNVYVTEAKRQVTGLVGIDGLAGPTELAIVADASADPGLLAHDLIAQAEHDPEASTTLITTDPALADRAADALDRELARAGRHGIVEAALAHNRTLLVRDLEHAASVANDLAPEHLQVLVDRPHAFVPLVRNAGAVFLGRWTAVPFGDYGVASNHVLPTAGTARFASGLRAADFVKAISVIEMDEDAARRLAPEVSTIARSEGLVGHARAVEVRAEHGEGLHPGTATGDGAPIP
jgi:histidinol dehydrogenase